MKREIRREDLAPPHLNDTDLVGYLDGELLREEMENARTHLESCWTCRSRVAAVQASIDCFVRSRQALLPDLQTGSGQRVEQFRQRLMRHASATEASRSFAGAMFADLQSGIRRSAMALLAHRTPVIAVLAIACLLVGIFTDTLTTKVSAETVLLRVQNYENLHQSKPGQVLRSSLRVTRVDRRSGQERNLAYITVLRDTLTPASYLTAEMASGRTEHSLLTDKSNEASWITALSASDFPAAFLPYFENIGWVPDVSVTEFKKLLSGRESNDSSARRLGSNFELHYPFAPNHPSGIAEVFLTVNAEDYSPREVTLLTADRTSEFRFIRASYSSEPRTQEIARLFPPIDTQNQSSTSSLPKLAKAVPLSYRNSKASETEVAAASTLHKLDACLGEELNIFPMSNGTVMVQGLVETSSRRTAIRKALLAINLPLRVEVFLPQELKNRTELLNPPDQVVSSETVSHGRLGATVADLSAQRIPLYDQLYQHFSAAGSSSQDTERQIADFSNQVVTQARQSFLHAWALRKLDAEFAAERIIHLNPAAIAEVERMRQDHRHWISEISRRENQMLDSVGLHTSESSQPQTGVELSSSMVLRLAQEQDDLVRSLFTRSQYAQDPQLGLARLRSVLHQIGG
jgi:hypothetical protein